MDANIENFQKFIILKIVKSVDYNPTEDAYTFDFCQITDDLISEIVQEGSR